jgi:hypothetical protein
MKTVPSGRVEWFMKGALRVGGMVGAGYSGILVSTVLVAVGMPVCMDRLPVDVLLLRAGSGGAELEADDVDDFDVSELDSSAFWVDVWRAVVVCAGVVLVVRAVVVVGFCLAVVVASSSLLSWAITLSAKKAERSRARFNESGGDPIAAVISLYGENG